LASRSVAFALWFHTSQRPETGDGSKKAQGTRWKKEEKVQGFNQEDDPAQQGTRAAQASTAEPGQQGEARVSHGC